MDEIREAAVSGSDMGTGNPNPYDIQTGSMTAQRIAEANEILRKYKDGKKSLEETITKEEEWYKVRHIDQIREKAQDVEPVSAWLFNALANKHAAAMDNMPSCNVLPREAGDVEEARKLSSVLPVVLDNADFEQVYNDLQWYKQKHGTGCYGVFWDRSTRNGMGDVAIRHIDLLNLFWQPGVANIQDSRNLFHVSLEDNELLKQLYPQLAEKLGSSTIEVAKYTYDDAVDTSDKTLVVDWYYKLYEEGRTILHYCKYIGEEPVFATEGNSEYPNGWYDDGLYPFVPDVLYPLEGVPYGFGQIAIAKGTQEYIDHSEQAIMKNLINGATPRYFVRSDGQVNEAEFADVTKPLIHVSGQLDSGMVMPVQVRTLDGVYVTVLRDKIDELKETTGNRDVNTGGSTGGVTAAAGIAAMQEAGSRLDRDANKGAYRAFKKVCTMVIERIRQFYDQSRVFRITGEGGSMEFVSYDNSNIRPQMQPGVMGVETGYRVPVFDLEIVPQKASPYSKMANNELALQFYNAHMFDPQNAAAALCCLEMMDFDRKSKVTEMINNNAKQFAMNMNTLNAMGGGSDVDIDAATNAGGESAVTAKARQQTADMTAPV